jgi:sialate O-acetylesterase
MKNIPPAGRFFGLPLLVFLLAPLFALPAAVKMPAIFGDHMVLQQDVKIPVWGWADPDESVAVTLGDDTAHATADNSGQWRVNLDPVKAGTAPTTLTVKGKNSLTFTDVLIGDVWICSGQSNMEFNLSGSHGYDGASNAATALPAANDPQLRFFLVNKKIALDPQTDVGGSWQLCTPASAAQFSAVGYFFGQELRHSLNRPIGLIGTYWGGTPAQAWTSLPALEQDPPFSNYVAVTQTLQANYPKAKQTYAAELQAYQEKQNAWNASPAGAAFGVQVMQWLGEVKKASAAGKPAPPPPVPSTPMPAPPTAPEGDSHAPSRARFGTRANPTPTTPPSTTRSSPG